MNRLTSVTRPLMWFMALLLAALAAGCGGGSGGGGGAPILGLPGLVSLAVTPATSTVPITGFQQYTAIATYSDGSSRNVTASSTWTSSNLVVAANPVAGLATGLAAGTSTITAAFGGRTATATFNVNTATFVSLVVWPTKATIPVTGTQQFTLIETFSDGTSYDRTPLTVAAGIAGTTLWSTIDTCAVPRVTVGKTTVTGTGLATDFGLATGVYPTTVVTTPTTVGCVLTPVTINASFTPAVVGAVAIPATPATLIVSNAKPTKFEVVPSGVTPNPLVSIRVGDTQHYSAIETFSDGTTQDRTTASTWSIDLAHAAYAAFGDIACPVNGCAIGKKITLAGSPVIITAEYGPLYLGVVAGSPGLAARTANLTVTNAAPTVTAVTPVVNESGVAINLTSVTVTFSEAMAPITPLNFTVACKVACVKPPIGTVALDATKKIATFTVNNLNLPLLDLTTYTATVTGVTSLATGLALVPDPYIWDFTTGVTPDSIKPNVVLTVPDNGDVAVPISTIILANFNEPMAASTITSLSSAVGSFTLTCAPGPTLGACLTPSRTGEVSYASNTATFTPGAIVAGAFAKVSLEAGKTYTAKINGATAPAATDIAGNPLALVAFPLVAADYTWSFVTAVAAPPPPAANVVLISINPADGASVCSTSGINATFGVVMDPATVNTGTFTVTGPGVTPVTAASVVLDGTGKIATFTPFSALTPGVLYTATIKSGASGVKDLTGNTLGVPLVPNPWTFTASVPNQTCPAPEPLGAASTFGFFSGLSLKNEGDDPNSRITGNVGINAAASATTITGLHDALLSYTETCPTLGAAVGCGLVTGTIYAAGATSTAVLSAGQLAYNNLSPAGRPLGQSVATTCLVCTSSPSELGGVTLAPGVYVSAPGTYGITAGDLTLDAQGNANAVWVFQMAATLTVGPLGPLNPTHNSVILINGAQAKNVFWYVGSAATINTGSNMVGNIISSTATTFGTSDTRVAAAVPVAAITTLNGRAMSLTAGVTMVNTHIIVPAP